MGFNFSGFLLLLSANILIFLTPDSHGALKVQCVKTLGQFYSNGWTNTNSDLQYAHNKSELPQQLGGRLETSGAFFFPGNSTETVGGNSQYVLNSKLEVRKDQKLHMYLRYYSHLNGSPVRQGIYVNPRPSGTGEQIPHSSAFRWAEEVVELDTQIISESKTVRLIISSFTPTEFFLVESIIIVQDAPSTNLDYLKSLCEVPAVASCEQAGYFPHVGDCSQFHVCVYGVFGLIGDLKMSCPSPQVWCQNMLRCENPLDCPCSPTL